MFLCKGISESAEREATKKREKSRQLSSRVCTICYSAIKGVVSADGDGKRSSGVDDLARNEPPSQVQVSYVVACSIWCLACIQKAEVGLWGCLVLGLALPHFATYLLAKLA